MKIKNHIRELEKGHLLSRLAILAVITALLFSAGNFWLRTISTGWKLLTISDSITYMTEIANTSPNGWTDERLEDYDKEIEKRNSLINSNDAFVAFIARSNNFVRCVISITLPTLVCLLGYLALKLLIVECLVFNKYLKYKKRQRQKAANRS